MATMTEGLNTGSFVPADATSGEPLRLAMQQLFLTGKILPVGGHLYVSHVFRSAEEKMIEAVYSFALPRDAAPRRFKVKGDGFEVHSELKPVKEASEAYEKGLSEGHTAALARQYRDGLINLSLGNIRPGEEITVTLEIAAGVELRDDGLRFRFPFTLAPSYHSQARAAELRPGEGEIELPADQFGDLLLPRFMESAQGLHQVSFDLSVEAPWGTEEISSPSHALRVTRAGRVSLAPDAELPDRDLILDLKYQSSEHRLLAGKGEDGRMHFAVLIPSTEFGAPAETPRTVVFLIDRSGSMSGAPMRQALKAAAACLAVLAAEDRFGLVAFDNESETLDRNLLAATAENRESARRFLGRIDARGGTELAQGIRSATQMLRKSGGDIFVLTDGQVFGTEDIIGLARATGCRLHTLGIGSASQDRFLALLARETGGISRFVTPRERVDRAALDLFASVSRPVASELKLARLPRQVSVSPDPPSAAFAGTPVQLFGDCDPGTDATMRLEYKTAGRRVGREIRIEQIENAPGETLRLLRGARLITDVEAHLGAGEGAASRRENERREKYLEALSREYSLASRVMALVAVIQRPGDRPGEPPKTVVVPVGVPQDTEFSGVFPAMVRLARSPSLLSLGAPPSLEDSGSFAQDVFYSLSDGEDGEQLRYHSPSSRVYHRDDEPESVEEEADFDRLLELSIHIEADGGMPGSDQRERILYTLLTLLAFLQHGHTVLSGSLRVHVRRMLEYLAEELPGSLFPEQAQAAARVVETVRAGKVVDGDWLGLARQGPTPGVWKRLLELR